MITQAQMILITQAQETQAQDDTSMIFSLLVIKLWNHEKFNFHLNLLGN